MSDTPETPLASGDENRDGAPADGGSAPLDSRRAKWAGAVAVWVVATGFVASIGWVAGANADGAATTLFGAATVPTDPLWLALSAALVGNAVLATVAAAVAVASRLDRRRIRRDADDGGGDRR